MFDPKPPPKPDEDPVPYLFANGLVDEPLKSLGLLSVAEGLDWVRVGESSFKVGEGFDGSKDGCFLDS